METIMKNAFGILTTALVCLTSQMAAGKGCLDVTSVNDGGVGSSAAVKKGSTAPGDADYASLDSGFLKVSKNNSAASVRIQFAAKGNGEYSFDGFTFDGSVNGGSTSCLSFFYGTGTVAAGPQPTNGTSLSCSTMNVKNCSNATDNRS